MSQTCDFSAEEVPVNAITLVPFDQFARVAATGKFDATSFTASPPAVGTRNSSQLSPTRRLNRIAVPSGEKHGQRSWAPFVKNRMGERTSGGAGSADARTAPAAKASAAHKLQMTPTREVATLQIVFPECLTDGRAKFGDEAFKART
jgi:hypothetical protein